MAKKKKKFVSGLTFDNIFYLTYLNVEDQRYQSVHLIFLSETSDPLLIRNVLRDNY